MPGIYAHLTNAFEIPKESMITGFIIDPEAGGPICPFRLFEGLRGKPRRSTLSPFELVAHNLAKTRDSKPESNMLYQFFYFECTLLYRGLDHLSSPSCRQVESAAASSPRRVKPLGWFASRWPTAGRMPFAPIRPSPRSPSPDRRDLRLDRSILRPRSAPHRQRTLFRTRARTAPAPPAGLPPHAVRPKTPSPSPSPSLSRAHAG